MVHSFYYPETVKAFTAIAMSEPSCEANSPRHTTLIGPNSSTSRGKPLARGLRSARRISTRRSNRCAKPLTGRIARRSTSLWRIGCHRCANCWVSSCSRRSGQPKRRTNSRCRYTQLRIVFARWRAPDKRLTSPAIAHEHVTNTNNYWHLHATRIANGRPSPVRGSFSRRPNPARSQPYRRAAYHRLIRRADATGLPTPVLAIPGFYRVPRVTQEPAYSRHNFGTPNLSWSRSGHGANQCSIFPKITQAALTKILPGEEDRFGK